MRKGGGGKQAPHPHPIKAHRLSSNNFFLPLEPVSVNNLLAQSHGHYAADHLIIQRRAV